MQNTFVQCRSLQNNNNQFYKSLTNRRAYNSESFTSKSRCAGQNKTSQREAPDSGEEYDRQIQRNVNEKSKAQSNSERNIYLLYGKPTGWTVSMKTVQPVYFCFGAKHANSKFVTKTAKKEKTVNIVILHNEVTRRS